MFLKVSQRTGLWGFEGLWFTCKDEDPHFVDLDKLSANAQTIIKNAIQTGELIVVSDDAPQALEVQNKNNDLVALLATSISNIRREVALIKDKKILLQLVDLESANKARNGVFKILNNQLSKLVVVTTKNLGAYDDLILDSDQEVITITQGDVPDEEVIATS